MLWMRSSRIAKTSITAGGLSMPAALLCAAVLVLLGASRGEASIRPVGPVRTLNDTAPCSQKDADVAPLAGGGFVAVWKGQVGAAVGIAARRLDDAGRPIGDEILLHEAATPEPQLGAPLVAPGVDGGFVVSWAEVDQPALLIRLLLRAFDPDGTARGPAVEAATASLPYVFGHDLAIDAQGRPAVVWTANEALVRLRLFEADLGPRSEAIEVATVGVDPPRRAGRPAITIHPHPLGGSVLVAWEEAPLEMLPGPVSPPPFDRLRGRFFDRDDGTPVGDAFPIHQGTGGSHSLSPAAASLPDLGYLVTWAGQAAEGGFYPSVQATILDPFGQPIGEAIRVEKEAQSDVFDPDVAVFADGSFAIAWWTRLFPPPVDPLPPGCCDARIGLLRLFDPFGTPRGDPIQLGDSTFGRWQSRPAAAAGADGDRLVAVWREHDPTPPEPPPSCSELSEIRARAFAEPCLANATRLCLADDRFSIEVEVDDPRLGPPRPLLGRAAPLGHDTGTFWFFRPENPELMVKLLDGRAVNGRFWLFSGALSNLGYEIVATDTLTGVERRYENRPGELASRADTGAFADPGTEAEAAGAGAVGRGAVAEAAFEPAGGAAGLAAAVPAATSRAAAGSASSTVLDPPLPHAGATQPPAPCSDPHLLCLFGERFTARVDWHDPRTGASGTAVAEPLGDRSGSFWFFRPGNRELVFKMLDGRPVNGWFWIFFGALTDLEYTITVEDRFSLTTWDYHNPPFTLTSHADVQALTDFPCPICSPGD